MYKKFREISSGLLLSALLLTISFAQSISHLEPSSGEQSEALQVTLISSENFYDAYCGLSSYDIYFSNYGLNVTNETGTSYNEIQFDLEISDDAQLGFSTVYLHYEPQNYNYCSSWTISKSNAFQITNNPDILQEINYTFSNCNQTGRFGPSQSDCDNAYYGFGLEVTLETSSYYDPYAGSYEASGLQLWTIPESGTYNIEVHGAKGGTNSSNYYGGSGAKMSGEFDLTKGDVLKILVGQKGGDNFYSNYGGGGGGGTYVVDNNNNPLIIAGGGGGTARFEYGDDGTTAECGTGYLGGGCGGYGGGSDSYDAGGGGGLYGDGNYSTNYGFVGGRSFLNGGIGGVSGGNGYYYGEGGFGGGGGIDYYDYQMSGGAGGYSGGGASNYNYSGAGGGGSYNAGDNQENQSGENSGHGYVVIAKPIKSTVYAHRQQVAMGRQVEIPIRLMAIDSDQIESVIFAVEVSPTDGNPLISEDMDIEVFDSNISAMISQGGDGIASVIISGFDPPISGEEIIIGNLLVEIPSNDLESGDIYHISFYNVSGSTADYEGVIMDGVSDIELTVITNPPEFEGLDDLYMIEGSSNTLNFTVVDLGGTPLSFSYDAPDYVTCSLSYNFGSTIHAGTCVISSSLGVESGLVTLYVENSEEIAESIQGSFYVNFNHYPTFNISGPIYVGENETEWFSLSLSDQDGDNMTLALSSIPDYAVFNFSDATSGNLGISPEDGDVSSQIVFDVEDDGNPVISTTIEIQIIVNLPPQFDQFEDDFHVVENDVITAIVLFSDPNDDLISYNVDQLPGYGTYSEIENGLEFTFSPSGSDNSSYLQITISDPGGMSVTQSANINVYNTYLAGDVRPNGGENAGDFGDDMLIAPDVVNALKVATSSPDTDIPDSTSSLYDAFDVNPVDIDVNADGDFYDEGERGGDGYIEAADVIVSLKRATMMPGYPNMRRADVNYPSSTPIDNGGRITNRDDATDALLFGNIEGHPGQTVQVPVTLRRGDGNVSLSGLVSGFSIAGSDEEVPGLESEITFNIEVECSSMDIPSGNEFLSLLLMDLDDLAPNTETLLGTLDFTIPLSADTDDIYYIYIQGSSGTTYDYAPIIFADTFIGVVPVTTQIPVNQTIQSGIGWNWFSINVESDDMSVNNVLSSLSAISGDFIKSQGASAEYYAEFGWFGSLEEINIIDMYQLDIENGGTISFTGYPADPSSAIIHLTDGWNWVGYIPQNAGGINDALGSIGDSGIFIKNQAASAEYYGEFGWFGGLDYMAPGDGYQLQINGEADLIYPDFEADDGLTRTKKVKGIPETISEWAVNPHAFEFNGAITLSVDNREDGPGDYIAAFVGSECRGVAERMDFPFDDVDRGIYILMAYSNMDKKEEITFKYFSESEEEVVEYTESLEFTIDMVVGNGFKPFGLSREFIIPTEFSLSAAYPNPFNPTTTLSLALPIESEVFLSIYNLKGREVASLVNGNLEAGYHSVVWNADNYSSGIYFVQMIAGDYNHTQKLMLVK